MRMSILPRGNRPDVSEENLNGAFKGKRKEDRSCIESLYLASYPNNTPGNDSSGGFQPLNIPLGYTKSV